MIIIIGILSGIVTGLGLGGGTILIIGLTLFMGTEQLVAQAVNLIFFIPTAVTGIILNTKQKNVKWNTAFKVIIASVIGAIIGASIATQVSVVILRKMFGIFLGMIAIYETYSLIKPYIIDRKSNNNIKG